MNISGILAIRARAMRPPSYRLELVAPRSSCQDFVNPSNCYGAMVRASIYWRLSFLKEVHMRLAAKEEIFYRSWEEGTGADPWVVVDLKIVKK